MAGMKLAANLDAAKGGSNKGPPEAEVSKGVSVMAWLPGNLEIFILRKCNFQRSEEKIKVL